jgi:hypothetical protein
MPQFYYYHNPKRVPHLTIHLSNCGNCQDGSGKHIDVSKGKNCVWTGPFNSLDWAIEYIEENIKLNSKMTFCKICMPNGINTRFKEEA